MLSLTPTLHSSHSICSGGVSVSGGALGLLALMCACANKGENSLIFESFKNLLCTGLLECIHVVRVALVRGECISVGGSAFV